MQYITLPHTDLRVSRVCLGTQQLSGSADDETVGRDFTWGAVDQDTATKTVGAAIDAGINFMDCAEAYNNNQAERALGVALRTLGRRHDVVLASKFGKVRDTVHVVCLLRNGCACHCCHVGRMHARLIPIGWPDSIQRYGKRMTRRGVQPCTHQL